MEGLELGLEVNEKDTDRVGTGANRKRGEEEARKGGSVAWWRIVQDSSKPRLDKVQLSKEQHREQSEMSGQDRHQPL